MQAMPRAPHDARTGHGHGHTHGHGHGHGHTHGHGFESHHPGDGEYTHNVRPGASRALVLALILVSLLAMVEAVGGWWSGSLALLADAGHMATDAAALAFSLAANRLAQRPASARHSYGLARAEVIAAFVNSLALLAVVAWLFLEAVSRLAHPQAVDAAMVCWIAGGGVVVNLLVARILSHDAHNLNIRAALLHVLSDLLGSVAALAAGFIILRTGYFGVDPLLSMLVGGLILRSTFGVLRESTLVLLDSVPEQVDYEGVGRSLAALPGVRSVHDLHIWSMVPGQGAVSAHLLVDQMEHWPSILTQARKMLLQSHGIGHVTLQPETELAAPAGAEARRIPIQARVNR
jgi:cobalt-zinc-cadmium efflux system protein